MAKKKDKVTMSKKEFVSEHKKLIKVLKSPSRADDKTEAEKQTQELKEYTRKKRK